MKNRKILANILILFFVFSSQLVQGQDSFVDSLQVKLSTSKKDTNRVNILNELSWQLANSNTKKSISYAKKAIKLSKELNFLSGRNTGHSYLANAYDKIGEYELLIKEMKFVLAIDTENNNLFRMGASHGQLGNGYKSLGDYEKATFHLYRALTLFEEIGDRYNAGIMRLNIGSLAAEQQDYLQTLKIGKEALEIFEDHKDAHMIALSFELIAIGYQHLGEIDLSLKYNNLALSYFRTNKDSYHESEILGNIGALYNDKNELDKALYYYNKSISMKDSLGIKSYTSVSHACIAMIHAQKGNDKKSSFHMNKSIEIAKESDRLYYVMLTLSQASETNYINGNYQKAYEYRMACDELKDTLYSFKKNEQIIDIQEHYKSEKREQEIINLKNERDIIKGKSLLKDTVIYFSVGVVVLIIIIIFFFLKHRKARENQRKSELEQKVLRSQMNPHFIFNSLNSIQRVFIEGDEDLANDYIGDFGKLLRIILEDSVKSKIPIQKEIETLKLYVEMEKIRLDGQIECEFIIDPNLDLLNNYLPPLILQPFVENAIWHGILPNKQEKVGKISVEIIRVSAKLLSCIIIDNGIGINESLRRKLNNVHESKGMNITQQRLGNMGDMKIEEIATGGTKITIQIPLIYD